MKGERQVDVAGSFPDLRVYQLARAASAEVFAISKAFPREQRFSLTDQIRRSARASDFCKYATDTDYRTMEESVNNWDNTHLSEPNDLAL